MATAPSKPLPPPPPAKRPPAAAPPAQSTCEFGESSGITRAAQKIVIYGPGGSGKTQLCSLVNRCGIKAKFIDVEDGSGWLDVKRVSPTPQTWDELRSALHTESLWKDYDAIILDSLTKAEELAVAWTIQNVPHEKGHHVTSIEGYGFGKGFTHVYETFLCLLADLDAHVRRGRHIISVAHECTANVPNPSGEDWIRFEPRLQSPGSGKASIRHRVKEWCDHLLYIGYDAAVSKDGKAMGSGTRTIYSQEFPTWWAKSRGGIDEPIQYVQGEPELWTRLFAKG